MMSYTQYSGWHNSQTGLDAHEDRGYGTALLEALISLAIHNGFNKQSKVTSELSYVDAKDEKKKQRRNMFYPIEYIDMEQWKPFIDAGYIEWRNTRVLFKFTE